MPQPRSRAHARRRERRAHAPDPADQATNTIMRWHISTWLHMPTLRAWQSLMGPERRVTRWIVAGSGLILIAAFAWLVVTLVVL